MSQVWSIARASRALAPEDAATIVALLDKVYLVGGDNHVCEFVARLPLQSAYYKTLYRINASALPGLLVYSELFGHLKGSFPGAYRDKPGIVWRVQHGLLVIEHFDELSSHIKDAICSFAETGEVWPFGATASAGIVAAKVLLTGCRPADQVGLRPRPADETVESITL